MKKPIEVALLDEADEYLANSHPKVRQRFAVAFEKIELGLKGDWFEKMPGTDELWEVRVDGPQNTHRLFAFWDSRGATSTLVVCTHGLDKKTEKTPARDVNKAERLRREYLQQPPLRN